MLTSSPSPKATSPEVCVQSDPAELKAHVPRSARTVLRMLERLSRGSLELTLPRLAENLAPQVLFFGPLARSEASASPAPHAQMILKNWNVFAKALKSGDIGFAESYIAGDWETPNLSSLIELFIVNRRAVQSVIYGSWLGRLYYLIKHWSRHNNRANSSKNIHAHYDIGNSFYEIWLDGSMTYSSALFDRQPDMSLALAQQAKIKRACRMAGIDGASNQRVLEIGCGWGSTAEFVAKEFGATMVGVTLSPSQLSFALQRMQQNQLKVDLRLQDYRDIEDPPFDAVVSIEMFEAVGKEYWSAYFQNVHRLLKTGGRACIQTIVIDNELFDQYIKGTDFIQQYIFPGGCLPSPKIFKQLALDNGFTLVDEFCFGLDYANTLRHWHENFKASLEQIRALELDTAFIRTWEFYLCYCEAGFQQKNLDVVQFTIQKN